MNLEYMSTKGGANKVGEAHGLRGPERPQGTLPPASLDDAVRHFGADAPSRESDADADAARVLRDLAVAEPAAAPVAQPVAEPISSLHVARAGAEPRASIDRVGTSGDPYRGGRVASERSWVRLGASSLEEVDRSRA